MSFRAAGSSAIVVITQLQPISILFTLPQQQLADITRAMAKGPPAVDAFGADNKTIAFSKESFVRGAQMIKDQFLKCKSTPMASLQFGFNEVHDGLRSGTIATG